MTLRTGLVITGDSSGAVDALQDADRALASASDEAADLARAYAAADMSIGQLAKVQAEATREIAAAKAALNAGEISLEQYNRELLQTKTALGLVEAGHRENVTALRQANRAYDAAAAGLKPANDNLGVLAGRSNGAAFATRNLNYQLADMAQGLAMGAPPLMVMMQQLPQAADAFSMLARESGGAGSAIAGLASKAGPYVLVIGAIAAAVGLVTAEVNKNSDVQVSWQNVLLGTFDTVKAYVEGLLVDAFAYFGTTAAEVWENLVAQVKFAANNIIGSVLLIPRLAITAFEVLPDAIGDIGVSTANAFIQGINGMIAGAVARLNGFITTANLILSRVNMGIPTLTAPQIDTFVNSYEGAGRRAADAFGHTYTNTIGRDYVGEFASAINSNSVAREMAENAEEAGEATGRTMGRAIGRTAAEQVRTSFAEAFANEAFAAEQASAFDELNESLRDRLALAQRELQLAGLTGDARDDMIRQLDREARVRGLAEERTRAVIGLQEAEENGLTRIAADYAALLVVIDQVAAAETGSETRADELRAEQAAAEALQASIDGLIGNLRQLGGVGSTVAGIFEGFSTGNWSGLGNVGGVLNEITRPRAETEQALKSIGQNISDTFGLNGAAGATIGRGVAEALQGAGIGAAVSGTLYGNNKAASIGGQLGGAAGNVVGGPIGSIVGSILGSTLGKLLAGTPKGSVTLGGGGITGSAGGNTRVDAATDMANTILDGLGRLAEQLNATVNTAVGAVSIGMRGDDYVIDPTGTGATKAGKGAINFGDDAEAAVQAAIMDLINDGVIEGLRAGTAQLLMQGGDFEKALADALSFEAFFKLIEEAANPLGAATAQLNAEFDAMRVIFDRAGASIEERAKLEDYYQTKLTELNAEFAQSGEAAEAAADLSRQRRLEAELMALQGRTMEALALSRALDLEGMTEGEKAVQTHIWALRDEATAVAEAAAAAAEMAASAAAVANQYQDLTLRLLDITDAAAAQTMRREQELAGALSEANRARLQEIFAAQDAATAAATLAEALVAQAAETERLAQEAAAAAAEMAAAAAAVANQYQDLTLRLLDITDAAAAQTMRREQELAGALSEANRVRLQEIFAAQDAATAAATLAEALVAQAAETERLAQAAAAAAAEMAAAAAAVANEYQDLTLRLLDITDAAAAQTMRREQELAGALSEANRARLQEVFAAQDAATAAAALAEAQAEATRIAQQSADEMARAARQAADEAIRAAEEAADRLAAIERERFDLTIRLYELQGNAAGALALRREQELAAALSEANRAQLREIYQLEDAATAAAAAEQAQAAYNERIREQTALVDNARNALSAAYEREAGALGDTSARFGQFAASLREFRAGLFTAENGTAEAYRQLQVKFLQTSALAATGDEAALGELQGVSSAFLEASRGQASTAAQYQRDVAAVARAVDSAIGAADEAVDYAELELEALERSVEHLIDIEEATLSVADAIAALQAVMAGGSTAPVPLSAPTPLPVAPDSTSTTSTLAPEGGQDLVTEVRGMRSDINANQLAIKQDLGTMRRVIERAEAPGGGFFVAADEDAPLNVVVEA